MRWEKHEPKLRLIIKAACEPGSDNVRNPASGACRQEPNFVGRKGREEKRKGKKRGKKEKKRRKKEEKKKKYNLKKKCKMQKSAVCKAIK